MKKLILSLALVGIATTVAFGQKKVVRSAERNLRRGNVEEAYTDIKEALNDEETGNQSDTYFIKGKIETIMFEGDSSNTQETVAVGREAEESFMKTFELEEQDSTSKVSKDLFKEVVPDLPANLQGEGIYRLKMPLSIKPLSGMKRMTWKWPLNSFLWLQTLIRKTHLLFSMQDIPQIW
jgi:hypothetical protein